MEHALGFIGFGEGAANFAAGFHEEGIAPMYAFDVMMNGTGSRKEVLDRRLASTGTAAVASPEDLMKKADIIFMVVPPQFAAATAMSVLSYMTPEHLFCDLTSNRPSVKRDLGDAFKKNNVQYADVSVMGAVPLYRHRTPCLAAGNGADRLIKCMTAYGMDLTYVGEEAGKAVQMKLTRSIFVKGIEALTMEMLMTARKLGIEKEIVEGIDRSFSKFGFSGFCGQLVTSDVEHAGRRSVEARECQEMVDELGINSIMTEAACRKLQWSDSLGYSRMDPMPVCKELDDLYVLWESTGVI